MRTLKIFLFLIVIIACGSVPLYQAIRTDATLTGAGTTDSPLGINRGTELSPAQITTDKDDFDPTGWDAATYVRLDGDNGIRAITSFAAPDASTSPQEKTLINIGSYPLYFPGEHPDGTAANRIITDRDFILYPKQSCKIVYDNTSTRWRIVSDINTQGKTGLFYDWFPGSITAADYGNLGILGIGSGTNTATASTTTLPAANQFSTATGSNGWGFMHYFAKTALTYSAFGSAHLYAEALVSIPTLSDGTESFAAELQLTTTPNTSSLEVNNTIGIRYSHSIAGGDWELFSQDNAGAEGTPDDLDVAVATSTLYRLRIELNKSNTEARAYINGAYVGRMAANLPNAVVCGARVVMIKTSGTAAARLLNVHNFSAGAIYP